MTATANPYERAARLGKAFKLAQFLHGNQIRSSAALLMTPLEWATTATMAGVKWDASHGHEETIALTVEKMEALEAASSWMN